VYEVKPVDQHHYIELTIIPDPAMPPEYEMESYKESRELITAVKGFIIYLMKEDMAAIVEKLGEFITICISRVSFCTVASISKVL